MQSLRKHPLLEQSQLPICGRIEIERSMAVAAIAYPFLWLMETLRQWRIRERQTSVEELMYPTAEDVHYELNTSFWFFPPPC
jgi:hypothetical protein